MIRERKTVARFGTLWRLLRLIHRIAESFSFGAPGRLPGLHAVAYGGRRAGPQPRLLPTRLHARRLAHTIERMGKPVTAPDADISPGMAYLMRSHGMSVPGQTQRAVARPAASPVVRKVLAPPPPAKPAPAAAPEPDLPIQPLAPGELERFMESQPGYEPPLVGAPDTAAASAQARAHLSTALASLVRIAASADTETGDRISAIREMSRIADALSDGRSAGVQRSVADIEAELARELRAMGWQVQPPGEARAGAAAADTPPASKTATGV